MVISLLSEPSASDFDPQGNLAKVDKEDVATYSRASFRSWEGSPPWYQSPSPGTCFHFRVMAPSTDSNSVDPMSPSFSSACLVQSLPHHDTLKLEEGNFVQWKQHIRLIIEGYELQGFLEGMLSAPPRFIVSPEGALIPNPNTSLLNLHVKFGTQ